MEFFDVVDENGEPTGEVVERTYAHTHGIRHRTAHLWVVRLKNGQAEVLLQKRSDDKDSFPGYWYISSAGHIAAGESFERSAVRELKEEMGIDAEPEELHYLRMLRSESITEFYGKPFHNVQVSKVYYVVRDVEIKDLRLQESEVSDAMWMEIDALRRMVRDNTMKQCIGDEEMDALPENLKELLMEEGIDE